MPGVSTTAPSEERPQRAPEHALPLVRDEPLVGAKPQRLRVDPGHVQRRDAGGQPAKVGRAREPAHEADGGDVDVEEIVRRVHQHDRLRRRRRALLGIVFVATSVGIS